MICPHCKAEIDHLEYDCIEETHGTFCASETDESYEEDWHSTRSQMFLCPKCKRELTGNEDTAIELLTKKPNEKGGE